MGWPQSSLTLPCGQSLSINGPFLMKTLTSALMANDSADLSRVLCFWSAPYSRHERILRLWLAARSAFWFGSRSRSITERSLVYFFPLTLIFMGHRVKGWLSLHSLFLFFSRPTSAALHSFHWRQAPRSGCTQHMLLCIGTDTQTTQCFVIL